MWQRAIQRFKQFSIRKKIGVMYGLYIFPILIILSVSVIIILRYAVMNNVRLSVNNNSQVIISQIEDKIKNAQSCANILLGNLNEVDFLKKDYQGKKSKLQKHNEILKRMTFSYQVFSDVDGIVFIDNEGNIYGDNYQIEEQCERNYPKDMLSYMKQKGGKAVWFEKKDAYSIPKEQGESTFTMGKNIVDIDTGDPLGVLFITIDESSIHQVFKNLSISANSNYVITNKDGKVVSSPYADEIGKDYVIKDNLSEEENAAGYYHNGQYLYAEEFTQLPYYLMFHAPLTELMKDMIQIITYILIIGGICGTMAVIMAKNIGRRITTPIIDLSKAMEEVIRGDMKVRCQVHTEDEIKLIGDGFNNMLDTIEQLIDNIKVEQRNKRKYELALIQSQIKPHFLYNTLDMIYVLAHMKRCEEAKKTTKALAQFYRVSLSSGRDIISIESELNCTREYLRIQGMRYADEFAYEIEVARSLYKYNILKLTIQPLVENAIYHGIKEKEGNGLLKIYAQEEADTLWICVADNGVGMDEEKCKSLLTKDLTSSFGIKNLNDRIQMHFGEEYGLLVESRQGEGTVVKIHIPKKEGDYIGD